MILPQGRLLLCAPSGDTGFFDSLTVGDIFIILAIIFIVVLGFFLGNNRKEARSADEKLSRLKHETDKELMDGIFYAQSLQHSLLPDEDKIKESVSDCFILYMPKDIVSGDFFWYRDFGGFSVVAVVDCTGHGIPGAFMSMIGSTLLNRVVIEKNIYDPSEILERMDEGIRDILRQDQEGSETDDGMEVCICLIDREAKKVVFAGAHRPLVYYSGGSIHEIKGTRRPIGGRMRKSVKKTFFNQEIPILPDTAIYLTTDGLIDQNDKDGKKFGRQRFFEALASSSGLKMIEQKYRIINELNTFRKSILQRDDITVIGIKP